MNSFILIPAYNADKFLNKLVTEIRNITNIFILIIDDGSNTKLELDFKNCMVIRKEQNEGKGSALRDGFRWGIKNNYRYVITLDADGQHPPQFINDFLNTNNNIDLVLGYRSFTSKMPINRRLSNFLTSKMISLRIGKNIYDSQCGYRKYSLDKLKNYQFQEDRFMFETEVLLKTVKKKSKLHQIKIPTIYADEISSIKNFSTTINFIKLYLRSLFKW